MTDHLRSWNDGEARRSVEAFVRRAVEPGDGLIEPADRIAVFDNDGTLWIEQPLPVQLDFIFRALAKAAQTDPALATQEPYKAILARDAQFFAAVGEQQPDAIRALEEALARTWLGKTPAEFEAEVGAYLRDVRSERFGVPYPELVYRPMMELFDLLGANGFRVFVCSGGRRDFMRVIAESAWDIPTEPAINADTLTYVESDVPDHSGANFLAHVTVGQGKLDELTALEAEDFDPFTFHPAGFAGYHLGNNGTAQTELRRWAAA